MIRLFNMTTDQYDLARFSSADDLREFTCSHGLDGIEVLPIGKPDSLSWIPPELVPGIHLSYYNSWYDAYIGDEEKVIAEYGSLAEAERILGGPAREIALRLRAQLDFCQKLGVKYVVWHVGNITLSETAACRFEHDSASVISAAIEIINAALDGQKYSFDFLVENLWGPGFTFTEPELTRTLLEGIEYPRKGIMLDVGHLMHTCSMNVDTPEQGVAYVHKWLDAHGDMCRYIRGVHLHCGASGAFMRRLAQKPPVPTGSYFDKLCAIYESVLKLDPHIPLVCPGVRELIDRISPEYLTYEFITSDRAQHSAYIDAQNAALGYIPPHS